MSTNHYTTDNKNKSWIYIVCIVFVLTLFATFVNDALVKVKNENIATTQEPLSDTVYGKSALKELGNNLWYDTTTHIVYFWNGYINSSLATNPTAYYAPNGLPCIIFYGCETSSATLWIFRSCASVSSGLLT